jgi:hypothetical protein
VPKSICAKTAVNRQNFDVDRPKTGSATSGLVVQQPANSIVEMTTKRTCSQKAMAETDVEGFMNQHK